MFKAYPKHFLKNYRAIPILSNLNKIIEKVVYSCLYTKFDILKTVLNLDLERVILLCWLCLNLLKLLCLCLIKVKQCVMFCWILVRFSILWIIGILLDKLKCHIIREKMFELLESYLTERKQFVSLGGYRSTC